MRRTVVAFLVAPLFPALAPAWYLHANNPSRTFIAGFIFLCGLFYLLQAIIGIPAYLIARTRRRYLWFYLLVGFFGPAIPYIAASTIFWRDSISNYEGILLTLYFGVLGAVTGLIFWLVARLDKRTISAEISN